MCNFNVKLQRIKEESLELQCKVSTHKLTKDPKELQHTKVENLESQQKTSMHLTRNPRASMQNFNAFD
jgi:hypothetical protein